MQGPNITGCHRQTPHQGGTDMGESTMTKGTRRGDDERLGYPAAWRRAQGRRERRERWALAAAAVSGVGGETAPERIRAWIGGA